MKRKKDWCVKLGGNGQIEAIEHQNLIESLIPLVRNPALICKVTMHAVPNLCKCIVWLAIVRQYLDDVSCKM